MFPFSVSELLESGVVVATGGISNKNDILLTAVICSVVVLEYIC